MDSATNQKNNKTLSVILTVLFGISAFVFIVTFSIGLPIYCRFFYYMQINPLGLPESTGYDYATIKAAYDQVLDYLTLPNKPFGTGVFKYSEEGAAHFADCKALFNLNAVALVLSTVISATLTVLDKYKVIRLCRPFGYSVTLISALSIFIVGAIIGLAVAVDFDGAFTVFHYLLFPGKDNWTFHPYYDEIITALPQEFFLSCAVLIGAGIILISVGIIIFQIVVKRKKKRNA